MMNTTSQPTTAATVVAPCEQSSWRRVVSDFLASKTAVSRLAMVMIPMLAALVAPWITPQNPYDLMQFDVSDLCLPPGSPNGLGMLMYWFGTDGQGRDLYSGILYGLRISLGMGIGSVVVATVIGTLLGLIAAYVDGHVDSIIMYTVDLLLSFPPASAVMMVLIYPSKSITNVVLTFVPLEWAYYAHTVRGQVLVERRREYAEVARSLALSGWRIAFRHTLPNYLPPPTVVGTLQAACTITLEVTLSFLSLGMLITELFLGLLISNGYQYMLSGQYWISFYPGIVLLLALVAINLVGDRLREVLNPRMQ